MTIAEAVVKSVESLPPDKQQEVMDFAEFLKASGRPKPRRTVKTLEGLWAGMGIAPITAEDIHLARQEMWGSSTG